MEIHFTIGMAWVEFFCHFFAASLYMSAGYSIVASSDSGLFYLLLAIVLTFIGAHL